VSRVRLADFDYDLPPEAIAQTPIEPRDVARLLIDRGDRPPAHARIRDLPDLLEPGDLVVVNDSRVIPARLRLRRGSGGAAEVLLLEPVADDRRTWEALVRPARRLHPGEALLAPDGTAVVEVGARSEGGDTFLVTVLGAAEPLEVLAVHGETPLPPYITTPLVDPDRYQTVYAAQPGSAAAPAAGLHLTPEVLHRLERQGVEVARVELVVGLDTFQPITEDDPTRHRIHSERYSVPPDVLRACMSATRVVAVGTTTARALESAARGAPAGRTRLFIHQPFQWQVVDLLLTNFHLPRTSLLLMVDAFVGPRWRRLYETALGEGYRFLSFGDAMLLDRSA
jgi:S-adenosylmethionine:tRNA ribosyltransferase-isomerase